MSQSRKAWAPRARTGCITCRNRRIKCDEGRPVCRRCVIGGRQCSFPTDPQQQSHPVAIAPKLVQRPVNVAAVKSKDVEKTARIVQSPPAIPRLNGTEDVADLVQLISVSNTRTSTNKDHYGRPDLPFAMSQRSALLYVFSLPRRTGHEPALDMAIRCVATILRRRRSRDPSIKGPPPGALMLYGEALRKLQEALNDKTRSRSAETLGATILLLLFEALLEDQAHASIQHALGASQLILHRGAAAFTNAFERGLLRSHMYVITVEGYFQGKHIFLEQQPWIDTLLGIVTATSPVEDKLAVTLTAVMAPCSGTMADVVKFFVRSSTGGYSVSAHKRLLERVESARSGLLNWYARWNKAIFCRVRADGTAMDRVPEHLHSKSGYQLDRLCIYEGYLMLCNRLYVALGGDEAQTIEQQSQDIAKTMIGVGSDSPKQNATGTLPIAHGVQGSLAQTIFVLSALKGAHIILGTGPAWKAAPDRSASESHDESTMKQRMLPKDVVFSYMKSVGFGIKNPAIYEE